MSTGPRLRFAPSPTGYLHVGNARAALYNYLVARRQGGTLVLRIEDTDRERHVEDATDVLQRALLWLGLGWDEGPYFQSQRQALYRSATDRLVESGAVYYCDCTREAIDARTKGSATPGYDRRCRDRALGPGEGHALRFRVPAGRHVTVPDLVRGDTVFDTDTIEDFVVVRSGGRPMFILANTVDDIDRAITHVIRGEDHLSNAPKNLLLWEALDGGPEPAFAHLPLLVNERRQKLSKRRDKVAVEDFRTEGFLPEAMINYLALCGWSPGDDREMLAMDDLVAAFRLDQVVPSSAFFDVKKLTHINAEWIRSLPLDGFIERCRPWLEQGPWPPGDYDPDVFAALAAEVQTRVATLSEAPGYVDFLYLDDAPLADAAWDKVVASTPDASGLIESAIAAYETVVWDQAALHEATARVAEARGLKLNKGQAPIRVAVTGKAVGPPLFQSLVLLGRERTLARLRAARARLP